VAAEGGRVGVSLTQRSVNALKDSCQISVDVAIPETKNEETAIDQLAIAATIAFLMRFVIVLPTVNFNDQSMFEAGEINDVTGARRLTTEMVALCSP